MYWCEANCCDPTTPNGLYYTGIINNSSTFYRRSATHNALQRKLLTAAKKHSSLSKPRATYVKASHDPEIEEFSDPQQTTVFVECFSTSNVSLSTSLHACLLNSTAYLTGICRIELECSCSPDISLVWGSIWAQCGGCLTACSSPLQHVVFLSATGGWKRFTPVGGSANGMP